MASYVYVIKCEVTSVIKIGMSINPKKRIIGIQSGYPHKLVICQTIPTKHPRMLESHIHNFLRKYRLRGEWFSAMAIDSIKDAIESYNPNCEGVGTLAARRLALESELSEIVLDLTDGRSYDSDNDVVLNVLAWGLANKDIIRKSMRIYIAETTTDANGKEYNTPVINVNKLLRKLGYTIVEAGRTGGRKNPHYKYSVTG